MKAYTKDPTLPQAWAANTTAITRTAVRETGASHHNGSPIEGPPWTFQYDSVMMVRGVSGVRQLHGPVGHARTRFFLCVWSFFYVWEWATGRILVGSKTEQNDSDSFLFYFWLYLLNSNYERAKRES